MQEVTHSCKARINFLARLMMPAAKEIPAVSGGGFVDCFTTVVGTVRSEAQWWQLVVTRLTALSISRAKRYCWLMIFNWLLEGWMG